MFQTGRLIMSARWKVTFWKHANSLRSVFAFLAISLVGGALLFTWIEPVGLLDSSYWVFITATTVGYGDISPVTAPGKLLAMFAAFFWVYIVGPLVVGNLVVRAMRDKNEWTHGEQEWVMNRVADLSAQAQMTAVMEKRSLEIQVEIARAVGVDSSKLQLPSDDLDCYRRLVVPQPADTTIGNLTPEEAASCGASEQCI